MYDGTITRVKLDRGFGFIASREQPDIFFHANDLADGLEFDEQLVERRVRFQTISTPKGLRAVQIQPAD